MICVICERPLVKPAKTVPARDGPIHFGPVCARKAGLTEARARHRAPIAAMPQPEPDSSQMALDLQA